MTPFQPQPIIASRRYPSAPLVGVGVVIFNAASDVLLIQRGRPPRQGQWSLPGGLIDLGERLVEAARREVREECGVEVAVGGLVAAFEPIVWDEEGRLEYHYVVLDYWATYLHGEPTANDDALDIAWIPFQQLPDHALTPETLDVIHKAYAAWQSAQKQPEHQSPYP
jgi:ADP-ribose pyrophosphatase YjhB (NUDIX family)